MRVFAYASSFRENLLKTVIEDGLLKRAEGTIRMKYVQKERKSIISRETIHRKFAKLIVEQGSRETWV